MVLGAVLFGLLSGLGVAMMFNDPAAETPQVAFVADSAENENSSASEGASAQGAAAGGASKNWGSKLTEVDRTLPEFSLSSLDETNWTKDTLKGTPWVINFWATWCPPCIEEIPSMNAAYEVLKPQGVNMLAINAGEGAEAVEAFFQKINIDFPNILGDANSLPNWSIKALPTTIVVNAEGDVIFEALGPRHWDDPDLLQRVVDAL